MKALFVGSPVTKWLSDGRTMELMEDFIFIDSDGLEWIAPKGSLVDGASIPRFFWRVVGSPFVGKYRNASVIHDVYCKTRSRSSKRTHKVFNEMMGVSGVGKYKAKKMYQAVQLGGGSW